MWKIKLENTIFYKFYNFFFLSNFKQKSLILQPKNKMCLQYKHFSINSSKYGNNQYVWEIKQQNHLKLLIFLIFIKDNFNRVKIQ